MLVDRKEQLAELESMVDVQPFPQPAEGGQALPRSLLSTAALLVLPIFAY